MHTIDHENSQIIVTSYTSADDADDIMAHPEYTVVCVDSISPEDAGLLSRRITYRTDSIPHTNWIDQTTYIVEVVSTTIQILPPQ